MDLPKQPQPLHPTQDRLPDQLIIVETVYHRPYGEEATSIETRSIRELETSEQPYDRKLRAHGEWTPLDFGWLDGASLLVLQNVEGRSPLVQPTAEEHKQLLRLVLEVGVLPNYDPLNAPDDQIVPFCVVHPGESARFTPYDHTRLYVRGPAGTVRFLLTAYPR